MRGRSIHQAKKGNVFARRTQLPGHFIGRIDPAGITSQQIGPLWLMAAQIGQMICRRGLYSLMHAVAQYAACLQSDQGTMPPQSAAEVPQIVHIATNAANNEQRAYGTAGTGMNNGCRIPRGIFRGASKRDVCCRSDGTVNPACKIPDRRIGKQRRNRQIGRKLALDLGKELHCQQ